MTRCQHCDKTIAQFTMKHGNKWLGYDGRHYDHPYWYHVARNSFWCDRAAVLAGIEAEPPKETA